MIDWGEKYFARTVFESHWLGCVSIFKTVIKSTALLLPTAEFYLD
ncbi:hypothetical protein [Actinobacillus porcinus]|nr:hypothetical protein [Actinobacillus porcinus]